MNPCTKHFEVSFVDIWTRD